MANSYWDVFLLWGDRDGRSDLLAGFTLSSAFTTLAASVSGVCFSLSLGMVPQYNPVDRGRPNLLIRGPSYG